MKTSLSCLAAAVTLALAAPAAAQMPAEVPGKADPARVTAGAYKVDPAHTQVTFTVNHLGFSLYRGQFGDITGTLTLDPAKPAAARMSIEIPMSGLVTTSKALTDHLMKADFFDAARYPSARFESTSIVVSGTNAVITGNLTIRDVTRPVTLQARFIGAGTSPMNKAETVGFEATARLKRSDFGVSYGIPFVTDEVDLAISAAFEKAK